jgi:methyl-accepting chemotaxis protein
MQTDSALDRRLQFIQLDENTRNSLRSLSTLVSETAPKALAAFYAQAKAFPETRQFFADENHMARASRAQASHWENLVKGQFDLNYLNSARAIGAVHARIGLEPRWYIGGYALIIEQIVREMVAREWPTTIAQRFRTGDRAQQFSDRLVAFLKCVLLDMDLVISIYFEIAEQQRRQAEEAAIKSEQETVSRLFGNALQALSNGDLTFRVTDAVPGAYEALKADFNAALIKLERTISSVVDAGHQISQASSELTTAADDQARRTEQQAASLEETAAALNEITESVGQAAGKTAETRAVVSSAKADAEAGEKVVSLGVAAMQKIEQSSHRIGDVVNVIDEMAFQTNLLALNAGVEAARAGESGRGFAVVASEVRGLAQRSAEAAKEIKALISAASREVEEGVGLVTQSGEAFGRILLNMARIDKAVAELDSATKEQATGLSEVNTAMGQMDQLTQQNAAMVEESTAACHSVASEAQALAQMISEFRVHSVRSPAAYEPQRLYASGR